MGGKEENKHANKKLKAGRDTVGKTAVVGVKDRETGKVVAMPVANTDKDTLQGFVHDNVDEAATVYTDDHKAYIGVAKDHETVKHSLKEYVRGAGSHQRRRELLGYVQAWTQGRLSQDER